MDEPVGRLQCNLRMQLSSLSTAVQPLWFGIAVNPSDKNNKRVCVACVIAWRLAACVSIRVCVACVIAWRFAACFFD